MSSPDLQTYQKAFERSSKNIQEFVLGIYSNINFIAFIDRFRPKAKDKQILVDIVTGKTSQFLLGLIAEEDLLSSIIETLDLEEEETDPVIEGFYSQCLPQKLLTEIVHNATGSTQTSPTDFASRNKRDIDAAEITPTADPLSHHDILNEIENPTPSNMTIPGNKPAATVTTIPSTSIDPALGTTGLDTQTSRPALEIGFSNKPHQNPAQNIAQKLDSKLNTPSASIPKEVFVPKKTDPYREPVL